MKKFALVLVVFCVILGTFTLALADGNSDLFNRMLPADTLSALSSTPSKLCEGTIPDALLGDYAGKGDQNVSFRLIRIGDKFLMVYAYEYKGVTSSVLGGEFKTAGNETVFKSDTGKLKITFENGGAFVRYDGYNLLRTKVIKLN